MNHARRVSRARIITAGAASVALVFFAGFARPAVASAAPGEQVQSFGPNGIGVLPRAADGAVLVQSDGKLLTVGDGFTRGMLVQRQNINGALDPTYGRGGRFSALVPDGGSIEASALQADGKVLLAGLSNSNFFVARVTTSGTLDPTFGTGGEVRTDINALSDDQAFAVAPTPDGKIVVAGQSDFRATVVRYNANGTLDTGFASHGKWVATSGISRLDSVVVQPDRKVVPAGTTFFHQPSGPQSVGLLLRLNANGTRDNAFSSKVGASPMQLQSIEKVALQATSIVVGGEVDLAHLGLARYSSAGVVDTSFGGDDGHRAIERVTAGAWTHLFDFTIDAAGRLVVVGQSALSTDFPSIRGFVTLFRFTANGRTDQVFGCAGHVLTELLGTPATAYRSSEAFTVAVAAGDIFVGAVASHFGDVDNPTSDLVLLRYRGEGTTDGPGYALARSDGGTTAFGSAAPCGSVVGRTAAPLAGVANDPAGRGTWSVASDGGVFAFGAARFFGSMGGTRLDAPIVGMAAAPDGRGYWLVASDGGIFAFGSAKFFGSMGGVRLTKPVVGMAAAPNGRGYWLVASDGGIFAFGSAKFFGSMGGVRLTKPVVGMAAASKGDGYFLGASDGGVFAFGAGARFRGSMGGRPLHSAVVGMAADRDGSGYWLAAADGGVFAFDAPFLGSTAAANLTASPRQTIAVAN